MKKFLPLAIVFFLAGCATSTRYVSYTPYKYAPKDKYFAMAIYPPNQAPAKSYTVIGRVEVSGDANDGVNQDTLNDRAEAVARQKGADAIINGLTEVRQYNGTYVVPGRTSVRPIGYHSYVVRHHPTTYVPYSDTYLRFRGELVVYNAPPVPAAAPSGSSQ